MSQQSDTESQEGRAIVDAPFARRQVMTSVMRIPQPSLAQQEPIEARFSRLTARWEHETRFLSDSDAIAMHDAYQQIVGMGPAVVPLILKDLACRPNWWFWALQAITGENPVHAESAGNLAAMTDTWLVWGRDHGYDVAP